jgi:uncharacterized protein (TIGR00290 family)
MLAVLRAQKLGISVDTYLTMCDEDGLSKGHLLPGPIIQQQVNLLGGQWIQKSTTAKAYADTFLQALREIKASGRDALVMGDIDLQAHKDWLEQMCHVVEIEPIFPLWGESRAQLAETIIASEIKALVVSVNTSQLAAPFCGRTYDSRFISDLPATVCPCGEDGEFHTLVTHSPLMKEPLKVTVNGVHWVDSKPPLRPCVLALADLCLECS